MLKKLASVLLIVSSLSVAVPSISEAAAKVTTKYVKVSSGTLNLRKTASTNGAVLAHLSKGAKVSVYSESKGWAKINASSKTGYVSSKYLTTAKPAAPTAKTDYHAKAVSVAKSNLGVKYRFGGISPSGFDCSGLVKYSYSKAGKTLPRTAAEMYKKGTRTSSSTMKTGDLMFFAPNKASRPTHVSIYIGSGKMIQAATSYGVSIASTSNSYWKPKFIGAKRI
ncbi:C40 family peptidase [Peribacillus kribbensis]|uniref:C40 family peptidase n=1 Tax=Peribacillus kribbensis TaxID=356658 RepID=UPI00138AFB6A|nr:SH3 domain-containing C40 family peptidase [Peribacillus kribbensis]